MDVGNTKETKQETRLTPVNPDKRKFDTMTENEVLDLIDTWREDTVYWLKDFCQIYGINDLADAGQSRFNAAMRHAGREVFIRPRTLRDTTRYNVSYADGYIKATSFAQYNVDLVLMAANLFIEVCDLYDKAVSVWNFCGYTGISEQTIYYWDEGIKTKRLNNKPVEILNILKLARERSLTDILTTAKRNPVGVLGILNHESSWNMPGVTRETVKREVLEAEELPTIGEIRAAAGLPDSSGKQILTPKLSPKGEYVTA